MIFDKQNQQLARSLRSLYSLWLMAKKSSPSQLYAIERPKGASHTLYADRRVFACCITELGRQFSLALAQSSAFASTGEILYSLLVPAVGTAPGL